MSINNKVLIELKNSLSKNGFRVKRILLSLNNYSFYHSATKDQTGYERFIGRNFIIKRIQSFILDSSVSKGAYLVSGYRGMGKTSVVKKALSLFNPRNRFKYYVAGLLTYFISLLDFGNFYHGTDSFINFKDKTSFLIFYILLLFLLISRLFINYYKFVRNRKRYHRNSHNLIDKDKFRYNHINLINSLTSAITLFAVLKIFQFSCSFLNISGGAHQFFWIYIISFLVIFILFNQGFYGYLNKRFKAIKVLNGISGMIMFQIVNLISLLMGFLVFVGVKTILSEERNVIIFFALCFISVIALSTYLILVFVNKKGNSDVTKIPVWKRVLGFHHYLTIDINLGKDNLTDKDVLRYIVSGTFNKYKRWNKQSFSLIRLFQKITVVTGLFFLMSIIFHLPGLKSFTGETMRELKIPKYLPSQELYYLQHDDNSKSLHISEFVIDDLSYDTLLGVEKYIKLIENRASNKNKIGYKSLKPIVSSAEYSFINYWHKGLAYFLNTLDYYAVYIYGNVRYTIIGETDLLKKDMFHLLFPGVINCYIIFFLLLLFILNRFLGFFDFLGLNSHITAFKKLKKLHSRVDSTTEVSLSTNTIWSFLGLGKRETKPPLDPKEIETELIEILSYISKIPRLFGKLDFIFVFDELDKVEPLKSSEIQNRENIDITTGDKHHTRRQEVISGILANMKYFLNTAKAKFIFIAGREMYDASLAGISDREANLDSIFNDNKIYVNSFYTEKNKLSARGMTGMTEQYLVQFLLPERIRLELEATEMKNGKLEDGDIFIPDLSHYQNYLLNLYDNKDWLDKDEKVKKIITVLKDFIIYVSYRSNGAPKKIANLVDRFIVQGDGMNEDNFTIRVTENPEFLMLRFSYFDQQRFALTSYLVNPIFQSTGFFMNEASDKLLVSISFLLDHLYKFHKDGFSYRSLSLTPEIVDINKEPEFRNFQDRLISFLSRSQLRRIVSGVYEYRFQSKIASEIEFISKTSETESAAFNFTLDESIELKRYFNNRLLGLKEFAPKDRNEQGNAEHINSLAFVHMQIGDLHFNDQEYDDAVIQYMQAIQSLRQLDIMKMKMYEFIIYVRNKLKLGLAFEKNKHFDNALMTYAELTDLIMKRSKIVLKDFKLVRFVIKDAHDLDFLNTHFSIDSSDNEVLSRRLRSKSTEVYFFGRPKTNIVSDNFDWEKVYSIDQLEYYYAPDVHKLSGMLSDNRLDKFDNLFYYGFTTAENLRILYQPLIAKLYLIEKTGPDGLKQEDIIRVLREFDFITKPLQRKQKRLIRAEFYNKIGDLLFFKNGTLNTNLKDALFNSNDTFSGLKLFQPMDALLFYRKAIEVQLRRDDGQGVNSRLFIRNQFYNNSSDQDKIDILVNGTEIFLGWLSKETEKIDDWSQRYSYSFSISFANALIDFASCYLCFIDKNIANSPCKFMTALKLYYQAATVFEQIGEYRLAKSQLLKILHIERESGEKLRDKSIKLSERKSIIERCIQLSYKTNEHSNRNENVELAEMVTQEDTPPETPPETPSETSSAKSQVYSMNSIFTEIREVFYIDALSKLSALSKREKEHQEVKFNFLEDEIKLFNQIYLDTNPYSTICQKNVRILQLSARQKANYFIFKYWNLIIQDKKPVDLNEKSVTQDESTEIQDENLVTEGRIKDNQDEKPLTQDKNAVYQGEKSGANDEKNVTFKFPIQNNYFYIFDSIGCCNEILKAHNMFGINYVTTNNMVLAKAHLSMEKWCKEWEKLMASDDIGDLKNPFKKILKELLNVGSLKYINSKFHRDMATHYNSELLEFHQQGKSLLNFQLTRPYLDDVYNDNLIHFMVSIERNSMSNSYPQNNVSGAKERLGKIDKNKTEDFIMTNYFPEN